MLCFMRRSRSLGLATLALLGWACVSATHAAAEPAGSAACCASVPINAAWGLPDLQERLLSQNAQLLAARHSAQAVRLGVQPAQAPDNPTVGIIQDPVHRNPLAWNTSEAASWSLSQNLYWPGKKALAGDIVSAQSASALAQVDSLQSQLLGQLRTAWLGWQTAQQQLQLTQSQLARLDQIKQVTKVRYAQNAAAFADHINAQVNLEQVRSTLLTTQMQADAWMAQIATLVGHASSERLPLKIEALKNPSDTPTLGHFLDEALRRNPQLKVAQASVLAADRTVELASLGSRPDFNIALTGHASTPPWGLARTNTYGVAVGMTVPLWYGQKEKMLLQQAQAQRSAAEQSYESQKQQTLLGVNTAWLQWTQSLEQLRLIEGALLSQARTASRLTLNNYSAGQVPYVDVLNAFNTERSVEQSALQARANALTAQVALDTAVGELALPTVP